jgi:hypothetical protein
MTDEKAIAYIKKCLEAGKMREAIDVSGVTKVPLSKEELGLYIQKYLDAGWMSKAIEGSKAACIELPQEVLIKYVNKYLEEGKIYSAVDASKLISMPLPKEKIATTGRECLMKGKLTSGLEAYKLIKETPPEEELVACASMCFKEGRLSHGLEAYKLINKAPPEEELVICGNFCFNIGQITPGLEAYALAKRTPTKELLRACGETCLLEKRTDDARKSFVAAQKIDEMKNRDIEVREISFNDLSARINKSWKSPGPKVCSDCQNDTDIKERFFILSRCPENEDEEERLDTLMKKQHGVVQFCVEMDVLGDGRGLLCSAVCGKCGSNNVVLGSDEWTYMEIKKS